MAGAINPTLKITYMHEACDQPKHTVEVVPENDERRHVDERVRGPGQETIGEEQEVNARSERAGQ